MEREGVNPIIIFVVLLAVLGGSALVYFQFFAKRQPPPPAELVTPPPPPPPAPPAEEAVPLPPLERSDALVRELVGSLSAHPRLASWLVTDDLARRFVRVVDDVARGESPRIHLDVLAPERGFQARDDLPVPVIDPRSFARYDLITEVVTSLDTAGAVALYRQLEPLFEQAYRELGYPEGDFRARLTRAIARLRATPVPQGELTLEPGVGSYRFADPALEELSAAQKHLLRMGPANMLRLQEKLRLLAEAAGLAAER